MTDFKEDEISHPKRTLFIYKYKNGITLLAIFLFVIALVISYFRGIIQITIIILFFGFIYSVRWVPENLRISYRRLKDIPIIKNLSVAFSWSLVTVVIIIVYSNITINFIVITILLFIFTRLFINTVVFDMRDIHGDEKFDVKTIPIILGIRNTKILLYILNTISGLFILIMTIYNWLPPLALIINITTIYAYFYIYMFDKKNIDNKFLCDIIVDGEFIFLGIMAFLGASFI